jgi:hypothetical protein
MGSKQKMASSDVIWGIAAWGVEDFLCEVEIGLLDMK